MLRKGSITLLMGLLMMVLAACGNTSTSSDSQGNESSNETETSQQKVEGTLNFYTSQPDADAAKLVEGFQAKYPDVKVETFRSGYRGSYFKN